MIKHDLSVVPVDKSEIHASLSTTLLFFITFFGIRIHRINIYAVRHMFVYMQVKSLK